MSNNCANGETTSQRLQKGKCQKSPRNRANANWCQNTRKQ